MDIHLVVCICVDHGATNLLTRDVKSLIDMIGTHDLLIPLPRCN